MKWKTDRVSLLKRKKSNEEGMKYARKRPLEPEKKRNRYGK